jgi:hypothetical protein
MIYLEEELNIFEYWACVERKNNCSEPQLKMRICKTALPKPHVKVSKLACPLRPGDLDKDSAMKSWKATSTVSAFR